MNEVHYLLPPMPDLGPVRKIKHPETGEDMFNVAGMIAVARSVASPQSLRFYRAFCSAWNQVKDRPEPIGARQQLAVSRALGTLGHVVTFTPIEP